MRPQFPYLAIKSSTALPGANTQGVTLEEARANLGEAVALVLEANRTLAQEDAVGPGVIREPLKVTS